VLDYYPGPACSVTKAPLISLDRVGRIVGDARGSVKHNGRADSRVCRLEGEPGHGVEEHQLACRVCLPGRVLDFECYNPLVCGTAVEMGYR